MDPVLVVFAAALAFFHLSEATLVAVLDRPNLSRESMLFSRPYCIAMGGALLEYGVEAWLFPALKQQAAVSVVGAVLVVAGEAIRKTAFLTAGASFTHRVANARRRAHTLVTHGIYAVCRHPGYLGWFVWCVGTQVLLVNPVCVVVFAVLASRFFARRIAEEEAYLEQFFPDTYPAYRRAVRSCLPPAIGRRRALQGRHRG